MGKVINWELRKKFKFDHINKSYNLNPTSVREKDMHKFLSDFEMQTDHLISARRLYLITINKAERTCRIVVPVDQRVKANECKKRHHYLDLARELKKLWNMKVTIITTVIGAPGTVTKGLTQRL